MLVLLIIIAVVGLIIYGMKNSYNDSDWVKQRIKGRNEAQCATIRYFCNEPSCLYKKPITDLEYDEMVQYVLNQFNFRQKALDKIGLDEDELKELEPVHFEGFLFDKNSLSKQGDDNKWRSSKYQVSWLFFSTTQLFLYQYTFNMDEDGKKEATEEYFYKDITNFSTSSDTIETSVYNKQTNTNEIVNVDSNRFAITVPGDKFYCSLEQTDYTEGAIRGMKSLLRDKKNN